MNIRTKASQAVSQELGKWLEGKADWNWYATLTFRNPENPRYPGWDKVGWKFAHNALGSLNNALIRMEDGQNPVWVAVMELQVRGVPHWHALVANVEGERRLSWMDWWFEHYGIARILEYKHELGARYYLGKYLTKQIADIRFSPALQADILRHLTRKVPGFTMNTMQTLGSHGSVSATSGDRHEGVAACPAPSQQIPNF